MFTLKNAHLRSNSYYFGTQTNIAVTFAKYVVWILLYKHLNFEKNSLQFKWYQIFPRGYFFGALYKYCAASFSHRRLFENFKIATKSQFILTILVHHSSSWKQIGIQNLSGRKCQHVEIFVPILESVPIWYEIVVYNRWRKSKDFAGSKTAQGATFTSWRYMFVFCVCMSCVTLSTISLNRSTGIQR